MALMSVFACKEVKKEDTNASKTEQVEKFTPETFSEADVPENIKKQEKTKIVGGAKWKDKQGDFLLVLAEIPVFQKLSQDSPKYNVNHTEAQAYLFKNGKQIQKYLIVESAPLDVKANFIKEATTVIDSDKNEIGEAIILIKHHTRGDVSASDLTLVAFTDESKYEMKGTMKVILPKDSPMAKDMPDGMGGEKNTKGFINAPASLLQQAEAIWEKYYKEDFEKHFQQ